MLIDTIMGIGKYQDIGADLFPGSWVHTPKMLLIEMNNDIKYMKNTNSKSENPTPTERMKLRVKEGQRAHRPQALLSWGLCPC